MLRRLFRKKKKDDPRIPGALPAAPLSPHLKENRTQLKALFGEAPDVVLREFEFPWGKAMLAYLEGLVEKKILSETLLKTLMTQPPPLRPLEKLSAKKVYTALKERALALGKVREEEVLTGVVSGMLSGEAALFLEGLPKALLVGLEGWKERAIEESPTETVVRGPREAFTESLPTNITLLRRRLKTPHLRFETLVLGTQTKTPVCVAYLKEIANPDLVAEVKERLAKIKTDSILDSAYIEEFIEDAPFSLFPTVAHSEKPDHVAAALLEGRVAILVDGSPFALFVPTTFLEFIQSPEDYYERYPISNLIRLVRYFSFFLALLLPSLYIAVATFHHEMLPDALLFNIAGNREGVPFPTFLEILFMEATFEALREAGIRMPRALGQTISIVGAIVLGDAAIRAGLVSPGAVVVVAITGISSFAVPVFSVAISLRILRFGFMVLGAMLGLFGIMFGILAVLIHLVSLHSFGVPYFSPVAPLRKRELRDILVRLPSWAQEERPASLRPQDLRRQVPRQNA